MNIKLRATKNYELIKQINKDIMPHDELSIDEKTRAWVAYVDGKLAGFCTLRILPSNIVYLDRGGIYEQYQGLGIHRKLIAIRERFARKIGSKAIITYTLTNNYASMYTLVRCNYRKYNPDHAWVGRDVCYFQKLLK